MSTHSALSDKVLANTEVSPQSITTGAVNGGGVDTQGWEGVAFLIQVGAITGAGTLDGRAESDSVSNFATTANVSGAALAQVTNANPNTLQILDVYRPTKRYVRCVITQAVNTVVAGVTSVRYRRTGLLPPTQAANQVVKVAQN